MTRALTILGNFVSPSWSTAMALPNCPASTRSLASAINVRDADSLAIRDSLLFASSGLCGTSSLRKCEHRVNDSMRQLMLGHERQHVTTARAVQQGRAVRVGAEA